MDTIKSPFTATATATGGRNGHTEANDGSVRPDLGSKKAATDCREVVHKRQITVAVVDDDPRGKCDEGLFHGCRCSEVYSVWNWIVREDWDRRLFVSQMKHGPQLTAMHGFRSALHSTEAVTEQNDLSRRNRRVCAAAAEFTQRDVRSDDADL